mmetsp:Transcript_12841/g.43413  ORF Transcript_12841/g.43413 Transcript_12841/m.43413 type:complete len:227 (-) Transcript_12841:282-962(-)
MFTRLIFSRKRSLLFRNRRMAVCTNHLELHTSSKMVMASTVRFRSSFSSRDWSKSESAATKITALTSSNTWIHFFRSLFCPPTSNRTNLTSSMLYSCWMMPVVRTRVCSTSLWLGRYESSTISCTRSRKSLLISSSPGRWLSHTSCTTASCHSSAMSSAELTDRSAPESTSLWLSSFTRCSASCCRMSSATPRSMHAAMRIWMASRALPRTHLRKSTRASSSKPMP